MYSIEILDDGVWPTRKGIDQMRYGTKGKSVGLTDLCDQFNFTSSDDDKDNEQIGYTPRVEIGSKVSKVQFIL